MKILIASLLFLTSLTTPAVAQNFAGCSKEERGMARAAIRNAKALSLSASVNIGDTETYERWFGKYSIRSSERVRANFKSIFTTIRSGRVTVSCDRVSNTGCEDGTYAWVYDDEPFLVHLCPPFFDLPTMAGLRPTSPADRNGTREGTLIHEVSHFRVVARTEDHCYSRDNCSELAEDDADAVLENADSYQYYAEDISFYGRAAETVGKPPVQRSNEDP